MQEAVEVSAEAQGGGFSARCHRADPSGRTADDAAALDAAGVGEQHEDGGADAAELALWPQASLAGIDSGAAMALSWRLSRLTVVADWVGSNPDWFPSVESPASVAAYLAVAREQAARAVVAAGLLPPAPAATALLDFALRPMQQAAASVPLREGPMLAIIECQRMAPPWSAP